LAGGWRRQHNEELHNLCASQNIRNIYQEAGEDSIMRNFVTCMLHKLLLGRSSKEGWDWQGM